MLDPLFLQGYVEARWRNFGALAPEVGGGVHLGFLYLQAGCGLAGQWKLDNRPLEVRAITLSAGWVARLWQARRFTTRALVGAVIDRLSVQRTDIAGSSSRDYWEAGIRLGGLLGLRIGRGVEAGVSLSVTWFPAARAIQIPDGPSGTYNNVSVQTGLVLLFGPRSGT